jgi:hypothetical protein
MTALGREPRTCPGCGYKFVPEGPDQRFCSGYCSGQPSLMSLIHAAQLAAAQARYAGRQNGR